MCFENIIGIKTSCTTAVSTSGFFIEDTGITSKECDQYTNEEYASGEALIRNKIEFASAIIKANVSNYFAQYINAKSLIDSQTLGTTQDNLVSKVGITNNLGGVNLTLNNTDSFYNVVVNSISLQLDYTGDVDVLVYNLITGELLDTIAVSCVANKIVTTLVNKVYASSQQKLDLVFCYNTTGKDSIYTILSGCSTCTGNIYSNVYITSAPVYLGASDTKIKSSLVQGTHTFGLSLNYSIQCSTDKWLCQIANLMALPILYKASAEIMTYATLLTKRNTSNANIDYERNKERMALYESKFAEAMDATLKKITMPKNDRCFLCNDDFRTSIILP